MTADEMQRRIAMCMCMPHYPRIQHVRGEEPVQPRRE
jgi:hypothetical protein